MYPNLQIQCIKVFFLKKPFFAYSTCLDICIFSLFYFLKWKILLNSELINQKDSKAEVRDGWSLT